jgi:hypothetical protein
MSVRGRNWRDSSWARFKGLATNPHSGCSQDGGACRNRGHERGIGREKAVRSPRSGGARRHAPTVPAGSGGCHPCRGFAKDGNVSLHTIAICRNALRKSLRQDAQSPRPHCVGTQPAWVRHLDAIDRIRAHDLGVIDRCREPQLRNLHRTDTPTQVPEPSISRVSGAKRPGRRLAEHSLLVVLPFYRL